MTTPNSPPKAVFLVDPAEVNRRMEKIRADLQPHFDGSALSSEQQATFYEHARQQIPITMEQESRGVSDAQIFNARQARLQTTHYITEQEFTRVLLPSLLHVSYMPDPKQIGSQALYLCASTDWQDQRSGKQRLMGLCDADYVSSFIHIAADNYRVLMACEREGIRRVKAMYIRPICDACRKDESDILDAAPILAIIRACRYPFAHVISDEDEAVYLCPGPKLIIFDIGIDSARFDKFMDGVKGKMA